MEDLGWPTAHIVGHSMGGMIAVKLAANHPSRIASLTVISTSAGGWDALRPRSWRQIKMAWKVRCRGGAFRTESDSESDAVCHSQMMTAKDDSTRTRWMLKAHFTAEMLKELVCFFPGAVALGVLFEVYSFQISLMMHTIHHIFYHTHLHTRMSFPNAWPARRCTHDICPL